MGTRYAADFPDGSVLRPMMVRSAYRRFLHGRSKFSIITFSPTVLTRRARISGGRRERLPSVQEGAKICMSIGWPFVDPVLPHLERLENVMFPLWRFVQRLNAKTFGAQPTGIVALEARY